MNRGQLIDAVTAATGLPRAQIEATLIATLAQVRDTVASGDKVQLPGFGTFEPRERGARTARNPATGADMQLAATRAVGFKVGTTFKREVAASVTTTKKTAPKKTRHHGGRPILTSNRRSIGWCQNRSSAVRSAPTEPGVTPPRPVHCHRRVLRWNSTLCTNANVTATLAVACVGRSECVGE